MPVELRFIKLANGTWGPEDSDSADKLRKVKVGSVLRGQFAKVRNPIFHRKFFTLIQLAFDVWTEHTPRVQYRGEEVQPNLDRFRKDIIIICGWHETTVRLDGSVRVEAKSMSFGNMDQDEFEGLYSKTIDVVLTRIYRSVMPNMTAEKLRAAVDAVLAYDK